MMEMLEEFSVEFLVSLMYFLGDFQNHSKDFIGVREVLPRGVNYM